MNNKLWCVYCHTNKINNKKYIGITSRKPPERRWGKEGNQYSKNNQQVFYSAIQKYGWDNFEHEILFENLTKEEAFAKEIELIKKYKTTNSRFGYNISNGGSAPMYGRKHSKKTLEGFSKNRAGKNNSFYGKHHSEETKAKTGKKVICLNNGKIYDTISSTGFKHIGNCFKMNDEFSAGKDENGNPLYWAEYFEGININEEMDKIKGIAKEFNINKKMKTMGIEDKIICLDTNVIYKNIYEASDFINATVARIKEVCLHSTKRKTINGMTYMLYSEYTSKTEYEIKKFLYRSKLNNLKDVLVCLNTKEWFCSSEDAIKITPMKYTDTIHECARFQRKYGGRHIKTNEPLVWRYLEDYEKMSDLEIENTIKEAIGRIILCKTDGNKFYTLEEAGKFYNILPTGISCCCRGINKTCGNGLEFEFI